MNRIPFSYFILMLLVYDSNFEIEICLPLCLRAVSWNSTPLERNLSIRNQLGFKEQETALRGKWEQLDIWNWKPEIWKRRQARRISSGEWKRKSRCRTGSETLRQHRAKMMRKVISTWTQWEEKKELESFRDVVLLWTRNGGSGGADGEKETKLCETKHDDVSPGTLACWSKIWGINHRSGENQEKKSRLNREAGSSGEQELISFLC